MVKQLKLDPKDHKVFFLVTRDHQFIGFQRLTGTKRQLSLFELFESAWKLSTIVAGPPPTPPRGVPPYIS